jgi:hypothetical protein
MNFERCGRATRLHNPEDHNLNLFHLREINYLEMGMLHNENLGVYVLVLDETG